MPRLDIEAVNHAEKGEKIEEIELGGNCTMLAETVKTREKRELEAFSSSLL